MEIIVKCTGESQAVQGRPGAAVFGLSVRYRQALVFQDAGLVCRGRFASTAVAGWGAVVRALVWLLSHPIPPESRIQIRTDAQGVASVLSEESESAQPLGLVGLVRLARRALTELRRRGYSVQLQSQNRHSLCEAAELCRGPLAEQTAALAPTSGAGLRPLKVFLAAMRSAAERSLRKVPEFNHGAALIVTCDGSFRLTGCDVGIAAHACLVRVGGQTVHQECGAMTWRGRAGSMAAEYSAVVAALRWLAGFPLDAGAWVEIQSDCSSLVDGVTGRCLVRPGSRLTRWHGAAVALRQHLESRGCNVVFSHVPRSLVAEADALCRRVYGRSTSVEGLPCYDTEPLTAPPVQRNQGT